MIQIEALDTVQGPQQSQHPSTGEYRGFPTKLGIRKISFTKKELEGLQSIFMRLDL